MTPGIFNVGRTFRTLRLALQALYHKAHTVLTTRQFMCRGHWILQRVEIVYSKKNLKFLFEFSVVLNCNLSTIRRPAVSQKLGNNGGLICLSVKVDCKTSARPSLLTENIFRASHLSNEHTKRNFILDNFPVALNLYLCNSQSIYRFQTNRVKECVMQYKAADF